MIVELRGKVKSAMARSIAAEQGSEEVAARVAALEALNKELHQIQVRLMGCCLSSCLVQQDKEIYQQLVTLSACVEPDKRCHC